MAGAKDFRELGAWQRATELRRMVRAVCTRAERAGDFGLRDQLLDAARSAPRNIAEGFGRYRHKEFAVYVRVAKGSLAEVMNHLMEAKECGYLTRSEWPPMEHAARRALKATTALLRYLETTPDR